MQMTKKCTLFTASCLVVGSFANAALVVDWGGDYVSSDQGFGLADDTFTNNIDYGYGTSAADYYKMQHFDSGTALIDPTTNPNYTGSAIYGAVATGAEDLRGTQNMSSVDSRSEIRNNGANDLLVLGSNNNRIMEFATLWDIADGTAVDSFSVGINFMATPGTAGAGATYASLHYMVEQGGSWYISETSYTADGSNTLSGVDLTNELWVPVTLNDGSFTNMNFTKTGGSTLTLNDVDWVGLYSSFYVTASGDEQVEISSFEVNAVPEPSTFALLGGFAALGAVLLRRRLKQ